MILKDRDGVFVDIERLLALAGHRNATTRHRVEIEEEIRRLKAGDRGESSAANHLRTFFGESKDWIVIHDLRLEHRGVVAQIDHLLIGRLLDVWVCESKHVANGVKINDHGEFMTWHNKIPRAMASPIEQTERHIHVLKQVVESGAVKLPTRLGLTLRPRFRGLVLISHGTIQRPLAPVRGLEMVIKSEHLQRHVTVADSGGNPLDLAKYVGFDTLRELGDQLVALHRPISFDWELRIGLRAAKQPAEPANVWQTPDAYLQPRPVTQASVPARQHGGSNVVPTHKPESTRSDGCAGCGGAISSGVRAFCLNNATRFGGALYCMSCQPRIGDAARKRSDQ